MYDIIGSTPFIDADYLPLTLLSSNRTVMIFFLYLVINSYSTCEIDHGIVSLFSTISVFSKL